MIFNYSLLVCLYGNCSILTN